VSGFVYGYSDKAYVGGVKVVVGNGGWQAETLTDSNGYYQVGGLGAGPAAVNLRLPPGATPVVFDWPIWLSSGSSTQVNLGYYWHNPSVLPVLLSGAVDNNLLTVQIMNQTGQYLPGAMLEVTSPPHILLPPTVQTSQGSLTSYDSHRWRLALGDLAPQANVTTSAALKTQEVFLSSAEAGDKIRLIFTYDQQKTPLMLDIQTDLLAQAAPPPAAGPMAAAASATPPAPSTTASQPMASAAPTRIAPLPTTGQSFPVTATSQLILALFLVLGLGVAGWQAKKRNQN
jgi:hypothetical protein